jgi:NADH pyrophosphatase NudC (nudix superfamily)
MSECTECGARVAPDENFCGNCGAPSTPASSELKTISANVDQVSAVANQFDATIWPGPAKVTEIPESAELAEAEEHKSDACRLIGGYINTRRKRRPSFSNQFRFTRRFID